DGIQPNVGQALVYHGSSGGLSATPSWTATTTISGAKLGTAVAGVGDVNGDGYDDVIVGAPGFTGGVGVGRVSLFLGSSTGLAVSPAQTFQGDASDTAFGRAVSAAGDVNGDGFADFAVGDEHYPGGGDAGRVRIYHGSSGAIGAPALTFSGPNGSRTGASISTAGDVNADGFADLAIGAPDYDDGSGARGRVTVLQGSP